LVGGSHPLQSLDLGKFIHHSVITFTFVAFASLGSYLNWRGIQRVREKLQKERNVLLKELNFIKDQFNSHFTFNFFNFCYNNALHTSSRSADSIASFTQMLHFSLKNASNEYIPLIEEITYIENFIDVQKCITDNVFAELNVSEPQNNNYYILPGILSTFIENSFKHGVFSQKERPILISISVQNDILQFTVKNKKANKRTFETTGVGVVEMEEILKLFYPSKHKLKIEDGKNEYSLTLDLQLTIMT
jgi:two-component system LytT family sensor kinase